MNQHRTESPWLTEPPRVNSRQWMGVTTAINNSTTKRNGILRGVDDYGNPVITCRECEHTGPPCDFKANKIRLNGVETLCRKCDSKRFSQYYRENRAERLEKMSIRDAERTIQNRIYWAAHEPEGTKRCPSCDIEKEVAEFYKSSCMDDGLYRYCKPCWKSRVKERGSGYRKYWRNLLDAQGWICNLNGIKPGCGCPLDEDSKFEVDHIQPRSKGGSDDINNLQVLCRECNRKYGARMPEGYAI